MTARQVGWMRPQDGQLFPLSSYNPARPTAYDTHKADWEPVFTGEKPAPAATLTDAMRADATLFVGENFTVFESREPAL